MWSTGACSNSKKYCQLARQLEYTSLTRSFIICLINKPHLHPVRRLMHMHSLLSCGTWVSALSASRIYLLYSAQRENQLIFIYFNVAPSCWAWQQYAPPPCLKNFMHYLQIYWPSSATKMKLLKFSFSFPCLPLFYFWVFSFLSIFFFVTFCWNGKQSNNSLFFFCSLFLPLAWFICMPKVML